MTVEIKPSKAKGQVKAPPSKSMAHRYLICAALSEGVSKVHNVELSDDIKATLNVISALGATYTVSGSTVTINGVTDTPKDIRAYCQESGSTLRIMLPICLTFGNTTLSGEECLFRRPLDEYSRLFKEAGFEYTQSETEVSVKGKLKSGIYKMRGDVSSQFISGMLYALSMCKGISEIKLTTPLSSAPYVDMTISALRSFGAEIEVLENCYKIYPSKLLAKEITVEGDYSNAAFLHGFNYIGGEVDVAGLNENSLQGDKVYLQHFEALKQGTPTISLGDCPDLAPVLFAVAAANNGGVFYDTERLKIKESDRGLAMKSELAKFSVKVEIENNKITVGCGIKPPTAKICSHNDHRIVMATSLLCSMVGGKIEGSEAVSKSWPDYFNVIKALHIEANINDT